MKKNILWCSWDWSVWPQFLVLSCLEETRHSSSPAWNHLIVERWWWWWWQCHAVVVVFSPEGAGRLTKVEGKLLRTSDCAGGPVSNGTRILDTTTLLVSPERAWGGQCCWSCGAVVTANCADLSLDIMVFWGLMWVKINRNKIASEIVKRCQALTSKVSKVSKATHEDFNLS